MLSPRVVLVLAALSAGVSLIAQPPAPVSVLPQLVIEFGEVARTHAWITVQLPAAVRGADLQLRHEQTGEIVPLQIGPDRQAWASIPSIPAEKVVRYRIEPAAKAAAPDRVVAIRETSQVRVTVDGAPAFTYVGEAGRLPSGVEEVYARGGYLHPVTTPSGRRVTEDYPPNHKHHHGIWSAWASTRFEGRAPDFWNMGDRKGRVEFEQLGRTWSGPLTAGFESRHRYTDLLAATPKTVLVENWRVVAYAQPRTAPPAYVFDLDITQSLSGTAPLELPVYRYGGVGMRGRHEWDGKDRTFFLTSTGRDRLSGHGTRASWVHMSGEVDRQRAGLAMLSHPDNARSPQPMRIHPIEPFFAFAPQQAGPLAIRRGEVFTMRYRVVVTDGLPDAALLDAMWQAYALPVRARVE